MKKYLVSAAALVVSLSSPMLAQIIPNAVDPGRVEQQQRPTSLPPARLPAQIARINQDLSDEALAAEVFVLSNLVVVGNSVLSAEKVSTITAPLQAGETVSALAVVNASKKLRAAYAEAGYGLVVVHRPLYALNGAKRLMCALKWLKATWKPSLGQMPLVVSADLIIGGNNSAKNVH